MVGVRSPVAVGYRGPALYVYRLPHFTNTRILLLVYSAFRIYFYNILYRAMLSSVSRCLSVCLSVTLIYCTQTARYQ